jgi:antirestriction protein
MVENTDEKGSVSYKPGEKFLVIAKDYEKLFREHVDEYKKKTFLSDKIKTLERGLEFAVICINYLNKSIEVQESRETFYSELKNLFTQTALERVKVMMALACKASPAYPVTFTQIAKWVYGDKYEKKIQTVSDTVSALESFGIVSTRKEGREVKVVMKDQYRQAFQTWFQEALFEAGRRFKP